MRSSRSSSLGLALANHGAGAELSGSADPPGRAVRGGRHGRHHRAHRRRQAGGGRRQQGDRRQPRRRRRVIGTEMVAQSPGDGYTLLFHSGSITYDPSLHDKLPYDTMKDLAPVTMIGTTPNLLVVTPSFPARSAADLIRLAREKPGSITYATGGFGSSSHLAVALFARSRERSSITCPTRARARRSPTWWPAMSTSRSRPCRARSSRCARAASARWGSRR